MINVSNEYRQAIKNNRIMYPDIEITLKNGDKINIPQKLLRELTISDNVSGQNSFDIGSAIINQCTLKIDNHGGEYSDIEFAGAKVVVRIGLQLSTSIEWIRKGLYTAEPGDENGNVITVKAYDNMLKFDRAYTESKLIYPATLEAIVRDACDVCGVLWSTGNFPQSDFVILDRPDDETLTFREVLCYVGQISCQWFRCDTYGALTAGFYDTAAYESGSDEKFHDIQNLQTFSRSTDDVVITGIRVIQDTDEGNIVYQDGAEGYVLGIEKNPLIQGQQGQSIAGLLGEKLIGLRFRKMSAAHQSDPCIEAGDLAKITDAKGNMYKTFLTGTTFRFGNSQKSECAAENPIRKSARRFSESTKAYTEIRRIAKKEKEQRELAVEALEQKLNESSGMFPTYEMKQDGSVITYYHDKPALAESKNVIKITSEAVGVSNDGGKTFPYGFQLTGEMITNILYATGINADYVDTGAITVRDDDGNIIFSVDMDTKQVIISGDSVRIGEKNATQALEDILKETEKTHSLNIILDNEYQGIPADYQGNISVFPDIKASVQVLCGQEDVSTDCSYSTQKSAGIAGDWDNNTRTYTVTDLTTDTGWVDITASYMGLFSVTKRFGVAKIKGGEPGEQGTQGINLLLKTKEFDDIDYGMPKVSETYQGLTVRGRVLQNARTEVCKYTFTGFQLEDVYTFSFYAKGNVSQLHAFFYGDTGYVTVMPIATGKNATIDSNIFSDGNIYFAITNEWKRYWVTWKLASSGDVSIPKYILLRTDGSAVGQEVYVCGIKMEKDATENPIWTPAVEDLQGVAGRTYFIEASSNILKRSKDNVIVPNFIEFKSYYRDGDSAVRTPYSGRFVIEETADGENWTRIYTSASDENAVKHYLYSMLADGDGNAIANANGDTIGIPRDIISVRCRLYAAGGTVNLMDMQSVAVVLDVDALTHEEIFNLLTNNSAWKGIYKDGDDMYISFTYAKGGTLELGGSNNGNGLLKILDASGKQIGWWNNGGLYAEKATVKGEISAESGKIGNFNITEKGMDYSGSTQTKIYTDGIMFTGPSTHSELDENELKFTDSGYDEIVIGSTYGMSYGQAGVYGIIDGREKLLLDWYGNSSDERLKDISEWNDLYDDILMEMKPIQFRWKDHGDGYVHTGFGAQTTKDILDRYGMDDVLVTGSIDDYYSIDYQGLHAIETASIQKNRKMVQDLQQSVQDLQKQIRELKGEV